MKIVMIETSLYRVKDDIANKIYEVSSLSLCDENYQKIIDAQNLIKEQGKYIGELCLNIRV